MTLRPLDLGSCHLKTPPELPRDGSAEVLGAVRQLPCNALNGPLHVAEGPVRRAGRVFARFYCEEMRNSDGQPEELAAQFDLVGEYRFDFVV